MFIVVTGKLSGIKYRVAVSAIADYSLATCEKVTIPQKGTKVIEEIPATVVIQKGTRREMVVVETPEQIDAMIADAKTRELKLRREVNTVTRSVSDATV